MGKLATAKDIYHEEGIHSVIKRSSRYALFRSLVAPYVKSTLGKRLYHQLIMYDELGYWPHVRNPRTHNEYLIRRKLETDTDLFSVVADKWRVRKYVANEVGEEILTKIYHVTDSPETIPFSELPDEFVIKPTHMSGEISVVDDADALDHDAFEQTCQKWLNTTYGTWMKEYWYRKITPRIIIEERLKDEGYYLPIGYDFFVYHGDVKAVAAYQKPAEDAPKTMNYYTPDWDEMGIIQRGDFRRGEGVPRPQKLDQMIEIAETLGAAFDHLRVDLYSPNDQKILFGELTVADGAGAMEFVPQEYDFKFGSFW